MNSFMQIKFRISRKWKSVEIHTLTISTMRWNLRSSFVVEELTTFLKPLKVLMISSPLFLLTHLIFDSISRKRYDRVRHNRDYLNTRIMLKNNSIVTEKVVSVEDFSRQNIPKRMMQSENLKVNQIVLLKEDNFPPLRGCLYDCYT